MHDSSWAALIVAFVARLKTSLHSLLDMFGRVVWLES